MPNQSATHIQPVTDKLARPVHDLRISLIDRCNFRCTYCMPEEEFSKYYSFLPKHSWLAYDEIVLLTEAFAQLGVKKVRLTGGEPLLRPGVDRLISQLKSVEGIEDIALTTNGVLLVEQAHMLKASGLDRLTVSLDSLNDNVFRKMNGGRASVREVLDGIIEAERAGFRNIKINTVVEKGVNDHTLMDLVEHFKGSGHTIRFIEYMDVGNCNRWDMKKVVPSGDILRELKKHYELQPVSAGYFGEVADRYAFSDGSGEIGFISSVTQPFCGSCTRARISPDGKLFTCLFSDKGTDLRSIIRRNEKPERLIEGIRAVWNNRTDRYSENRGRQSEADSHRHKVEMFQIGG